MLSAYKIFPQEYAVCSDDVRGMTEIMEWLPEGCCGWNEAVHAGGK